MVIYRLAGVICLIIIVFIIWFYVTMAKMSYNEINNPKTVEADLNIFLPSVDKIECVSAHVRGSNYYVIFDVSDSEYNEFISQNKYTVNIMPLDESLRNYEDVVIGKIRLFSKSKDTYLIPSNDNAEGFIGPNVTWVAHMLDEQTRSRRVYLIKVDGQMK